MRAYIKEEIQAISSNIEVLKKKKHTSETVSLLTTTKEMLLDVNIDEITKENIIWNLNKIYGQYFIKKGVI
jgi:hypothetical protein